MTTLITANLILWFSILAYFMPASIDSEIDNQDNVVSIHKLDNK